MSQLLFKEPEKQGSVPFFLVDRLLSGTCKVAVSDHCCKIIRMLEQGNRIKIQSSGKSGV